MIKGSPIIGARVLQRMVSARHFLISHKLTRRELALRRRMDERVGVEKLLGVSGVISVSVLEGLSFAPNIGAEAWGVPVHFLGQACVKISQNYEMICVRVRGNEGVKGVPKIKLACQVLLGIFNLARGIDTENGNGVGYGANGDLANPWGMRQEICDEWS